MRQKTDARHYSTVSTAAGLETLCAATDSARSSDRARHPCDRTPRGGREGPTFGHIIRALINWIDFDGLPCKRQNGQWLAGILIKTFTTHRLPTPPFNSFDRHAEVPPGRIVFHFSFAQYPIYAYSDGSRRVCLFVWLGFFYVYIYIYRDRERER